MISSLRTRFLLTAVALMKGVSNDNLDSIMEVFRFWHEKGLTDKDKILFFLMYISETKDIEPKELQALLEEIKIAGCDLMPTLAQRWKDEGKQEGIEKKAKETAKKMLEDGLPLDTISKYTGLTEKEIKALMH